MVYAKLNPELLDLLTAGKDLSSSSPPSRFHLWTDAHLATGHSANGEQKITLKFDKDQNVWVPLFVCCVSCVNKHSHHHTTPQMFNVNGQAFTFQSNDELQEHELYQQVRRSTLHHTTHYPAGAAQTPRHLFASAHRSPFSPLLLLLLLCVRLLCLPHLPHSHHAHTALTPHHRNTTSGRKLDPSRKSSCFNTRRYERKKERKSGVWWGVA